MSHRAAVHLPQSFGHRREVGFANEMDFIIVGGGIIGLSTAMAVLQRLPGLRVLVLEKEPQLGFHQSSHNSGVIHSGLYYRPGSIKAKTCLSGAAEMTRFCQDHGIPHKICGKLITATQEQELPLLEELFRRGTANGVPGLRILMSEQMREIEPHCAGVRALYVPGTGITDYSLVTLKFAEMVKERGGELRTCVKAMGFLYRDGGVIVETTVGPFKTRFVVNCAGLHSDRVSRLAGACTDSIIVPFRGEYYELRADKEYLVKGLIYPVPNPQFPFLGVHFTRRIQGGVEAGPNAVLAFKREGYRKTDFSLTETVTTLMYPGFWRMAKRYWRTGIAELHRSLSKRAFVLALQRLVPEVREVDLRPSGSGVRAQALERNGTLVDDFRFARSDRMMHVLNVPSPAATASIPLGRMIADMLIEEFGLVS